MGIELEGLSDQSFKLHGIFITKVFLLILNYIGFIYLSMFQREGFLAFHQAKENPMCKAACH